MKMFFTSGLICLVLGVSLLTLDTITYPGTGVCIYKNTVRGDY